MQTKISNSDAIAAALRFAKANLQARIDNGKLPLNAGDDNVAVDTQSESALKAAWEKVSVKFTRNGEETEYFGVFVVSSGEAKFDLKLRHGNQTNSDYNYHVPFHPFAAEAKEAAVAEAKKVQLAAADKKKEELAAAATKKAEDDKAKAAAEKASKPAFAAILQATVTKLNKDGGYKKLTAPKQTEKRVTEVKAAAKGVAGDAYLKALVAKLADAYKG